MIGGWAEIINKTFRVMTITDIVAEARALCDADTTSYTAATMLRRVNSALEELVGMIINADGSWQFDDTNHDDLPRGKGNLVDGQESYTFTSDYLQIEEISILDKNSLYRKIKPFDPADFDGMTADEYWGVDSSGDPNKGMPEVYDIKGDSIRLYPAPDTNVVTLTNGIRVSFKRTADLYTSAEVITGTKEPGLPSTHHSILSYMAAIPYCMKFHPKRVSWLEKKVDEMKRTLLEHYASREKDRRTIITPKRRPFR